MAYQIEITDTFGGESNYSWVKRKIFDWPDTLTRRQIVRRAKSFAGWSGWRCNVSGGGDLVEIKPIGACMVCFVIWTDMESDETTARKILNHWLDIIGIGFHIDTRGGDYSPLLTAEQITKYETDMESLFKLRDLDSDVYKIAADIMESRYANG